MDSEPASASRGLLLDWKYRPRTWVRLTLFVLLALLGHLVCFLLFSIRPPRLARGVPVPFAVTAARPGDENALPPGSSSIVPSPLAELGLPEITAVPRYEPSYQNRPLARQAWPARDEVAAWPEITGASQFVLPPQAEAPVSSPGPQPMPPTPPTPEPAGNHGPPPPARQ